MSAMPDDPTIMTADDEPIAGDATEVAADDDAQLDELAPNGGGTSGNHGNGTAG
jgi:hypothetical protein